MTQDSLLKSSNLTKTRISQTLVLELIPRIAFLSSQKSLTCNEYSKFILLLIFRRALIIVKHPWVLFASTQIKIL